MPYLIIFIVILCQTSHLVLLWFSAYVRTFQMLSLVSNCSIVQLASTPPLPFFRFTHDGLSPRAGIYNGSGKRQVILIFL